MAKPANKGDALTRKVPVDLTGHHADCDANYLRLLKLLPDHAERSHWRYAIGSGNSQTSIAFELSARDRYTTTVEMHLEGSGDWNRLPPLTLRLYHDARMAEVVAVNRRHGIAGQMPLGQQYPNARMQYADEKAQVNRLLAEALAACLSSGRAGDAVIGVNREGLVVVRDGK